MSTPTFAQQSSRGGQLLLVILALILAVAAFGVAVWIAAGNSGIITTVSDLKKDLPGMVDRAVKDAMAKTTPPSPAPTAAIKPTSDVSPEQLKSATEEAGEGVENPFTRQLMADPDLGQFIDYDGDANDTAALKLWAQGEAHRIAIGTGYFSMKFGASIGAKKPGTVAYVLTKRANGMTDVSEYLVASPEKPQQIRGSVDKLSKAAFLGTPGPDDKPAVLPAYEFMQE